ncbi:hypothetical protein JF770_06390 [Mycobacterium intracellulare]|uniref:hypothetical protein n=1 Tax=Mycobacterium intracellulare TaxID=1767 RepID=UPI001CD9FBAC|nr:hypothetical protein [Mycobacterium intracellulare]MCA2303183.1 hypothetical protein [Mycobacterium intracellulare]MCA2346458.1 hypothetical protein [Mycobacterium intracellulare]
MSVQDSFGPHETPGQPYDSYRHEESREASRIAYGLIRCFLNSIGKDEFAWAVGHRALAEASSMLLGEDLGLRWRGVLAAIAAEAASTRLLVAGGIDHAITELDRKIHDNS